MQQQRQALIGNTANISFYRWHALLQFLAFPVLPLQTVIFQQLSEIPHIFGYLWRHTFEQEKFHTTDISPRSTTSDSPQ